MLVGNEGMVLRPSRKKNGDENWLKQRKRLLMGIEQVGLQRINHFVKNSAHFVLKIELLPTVLSDFEMGGALGEPAL